MACRAPSDGSPETMMHVARCSSTCARPKNEDAGYKARAQARAASCAAAAPSRRPACEWTQLSTWRRRADCLVVASQQCERLRRDEASARFLLVEQGLCFDGDRL